MPTGKEPFVVHKWETATGYHHVYFGKNFNDPKNRKRFRNWTKALHFAVEKAEKQGNKAILVDAPPDMGGTYRQTLKKTKPKKSVKKRKRKTSKKQDEWAWLKKI